MKFLLLCAAGIFAAACTPDAPQAPPAHREPPPLVVTLPERTKPVEGNSGRVVGVHDGDTITVLTPDNVQLKIRLVEIDAPEIKQPFGQQSKQALSALVFGKSVEIRPTGKDRYGRTLARVFVDGTDVNLAMVKAGMAWRFDKYSKDGAFQTAQQEAQRARRGLWAEPAPVAPWEWRAVRKGRMQVTSGTDPAPHRQPSFWKKPTGLSRAGSFQNNDCSPSTCYAFHL